MPFVQGSAIEKALRGSAEVRLETIHQCVCDHYPGTPLRIMATFEDHVIAFTGENKLLKISYSIDEDNNYYVTGDKSSRAIPVIKDEDIAPVVAKNLREMANTILRGKPIKRTQVREMAALTKKDEMYWLSDIIAKLDESCGDTDWFKMYEANIERVRTSLYGRIKDIEGTVPKTRYSKIAAAKLGAFKDEMKESLQIINDMFVKYSQVCEGYSFDDKQSFLSAVRDSLIAEAQAIVGLLGKAEKLMRQADLPLMAGAHDKLADRARTMALVSSYLNTKAQPTSKEN